MSRIPRNVAESHSLGGYYAEDRALLRRCDRAARTEQCIVCDLALHGREANYGLHDLCGWTLPHQDEMTIRSTVAMRRFELA